MFGRQRNIRTLAIALTALALPATGLVTQASAAPLPPPSIRLIAGSDSAVIHLFPDGRYEVHLPIFVAADGGSFELWRQRATYDDPITTSQVVRDDNGVIIDTLPIAGLTEPTMSGGLPDFLTTNLAKRNGTPIKNITRDFCPNDWQPQRVDDSGPVTPTFPVLLLGFTFTRGMVLGIDQGWSTQAQATLGQHLKIDPGTYQLTVSIGEPYRTAFGIAPEDAEVSVPVIAIKANARHTRGAWPRRQLRPTLRQNGRRHPLALPPTLHSPTSRPSLPTASG